MDYARAFDCVDHNKLWKIIKDMGIPDHLTCLLRNLYAGQEAIVRRGTTDLFGTLLKKHQLLVYVYGQFMDFLFCSIDLFYLFLYQYSTIFVIHVL